MKDFLIAGTITKYNTTGYYIGERPHPFHSFSQFFTVFHNFHSFQQFLAVSTIFYNFHKHLIYYKKRDYYLSSPNKNKVLPQGSTIKNPTQPANQSYSHYPATH